MIAPAKLLEKVLTLILTVLHSFATCLDTDPLVPQLEQTLRCTVSPWDAEIRMSQGLSRFRLGMGVAIWSQKKNGKEPNVATNNILL